LSRSTGSPESNLPIPEKDDSWTKSLVTFSNQVSSIAGRCHPADARQQGSATHLFKPAGLLYAGLPTTASCRRRNAPQTAET